MLIMFIIYNPTKLCSFLVYKRNSMKLIKIIHTIKVLKGFNLCTVKFRVYTLILVLYTIISVVFVVCALALGAVPAALNRHPGGHDLLSDKRS